MADLAHDGHKVPHDESGPMSGSINCCSDNRSEQLKEIDSLVKVYGNSRSTQAAEHNILSYPEGYRPTRREIERDIRINMKKLGMEDHLVIWDAHSNTENFHVHFLLCRVSPTPNDSGKYHLADNGLVQVTRKDKRGRIRTRTDEAACRQAAIAEINEHYGFSNGSLTHSKDGTPTLRIKDKDRHSDKTKAGERKTGKQSKERQLSQQIKEVFDKAAKESIILQKSFWAVADKLFAEKAIKMTIKWDCGKPTGGFITGPDNRKCGFGKAGKEYTTPALIRRFGQPHLSDSANFTDNLQPFEYTDIITVEEAKKRLIPVFKNANSWDLLIGDIERLGMHLIRSGGGLSIRYNKNDSITASHVNNKFSLFHLEKKLGACPLPKTSPTFNDKREQLRQAAEVILFKNISENYGLHKVEYDFSQANIQLLPKTFTSNDGNRVNFWAIEKDGLSIPLSKIATSSDGKPIYTMSHLEFLDQKDMRYQKQLNSQNWRSWADGLANSERAEELIREYNRKKEQKINSISFFAAAIKFIKQRPGEYNEHIAQNHP